MGVNCMSYELDTETNNILDIISNLGNRIEAMENRLYELSILETETGVTRIIARD